MNAVNGQHANAEGQIIVQGDENYPGISQARWLLVGLFENLYQQFRHPGQHTDRYTKQLVLDILQAFPVLASEKSFNRVQGVAFYGAPGQHPITLCVRLGFNKSLIKAIYELFPRAISTNQGSNNRPEYVLHLACLQLLQSMPQQNGVIQFLAQENPLAVQTRDSRGLLPIEYAILQYRTVANTTKVAASFATIKLLIEIYPDCLNGEGVTRKLIFEQAFTSGVSAEILNYIRTNTPIPIHGLHLLPLPRGLHIGAHNITSNRVKLLDPVLERLHTFHCSSTRITFQGYHRLLGSLTKNKSIHRATLPIVPYRFEPFNKILMDESIFTFLQTNSSIQKIEFYQDGRFLTPTSLLCAIRRGLMPSSNRTIKGIEFEGIRLNGLEPVAELLSTATNVERMFLTNLHIEDSFDKTELESCNVKYFLYKDKAGNSTPTVLSGMLNLGLSMPHLTIIVLEVESDFEHLDLTASVVALLQKPSLKGIVIGTNAVTSASLAVDESQIWNVLKENRTFMSYDFPITLNTPYKLKTFLNVVMMQNTTLINVTVGAEMMEDVNHEKLCIFRRMNRHGRGRLRAANASPEVLGELLFDLWYNFERQVGYQMTDLYKVDVTYCLLLVNPGLLHDIRGQA